MKRVEMNYNSLFFSVTLPSPPPPPVPGEVINHIPLLINSVYIIKLKITNKKFNIQFRVNNYGVRDCSFLKTEHYILLEMTTGPGSSKFQLSRLR